MHTPEQKSREHITGKKKKKDHKRQACNVGSNFQPGNAIGSYISHFPPFLGPPCFSFRRTGLGQRLSRHGHDWGDMCAIVPS